MTSQGTFPPTRKESGFLLMGSDSQPHSANCRMKSQYKFMEGMSVPGKWTKQGQVLDFLQIMRSLVCFQDFPHQNTPQQEAPKDGLSSTNSMIASVSYHVFQGFVTKTTIYSFQTMMICLIR